MLVSNQANLIKSHFHHMTLSFKQITLGQSLLSCWLSFSLPSSVFWMKKKELSNPESISTYILLHCETLSIIQPWEFAHCKMCYLPGSFHHRFDVAGKCTKLQIYKFTNYISADGYTLRPLRSQTLGLWK